MNMIMDSLSLSSSWIWIMNNEYGLWIMNMNNEYDYGFTNYYWFRFANISI